MEPLQAKPARRADRAGAHSSTLRVCNVRANQMNSTRLVEGRL